MDQTSAYAAEKIEDEISNVAESVFNVVAENIEEPYVHDNMKESSVQKHGTQKREILLETCKVSRKFRIGVSEGDNSIEIEDLFQIRTLSEFP